MGVEIIGALVSAIFGLLFGVFQPLLNKIIYPKAEKYYLENPESNWSKFLQQIFIFNKDKNKPFKERLSHSLSTLKNATEEIDGVIEEISKISKEKQQTIEKLETTLTELETRENDLKEKISTMEKIPVESLKHFEEILNKGNKRSATRDYVIFVSGIILTTIIAILLNKFM
ncbi:hypothetical protein [Flagellimonas pelagia]|uniref:Uncharacterized protein n=1 Tax=Flagellimonas pelagia TaxID=2306998 RepID=A0A3A1NPN1_9FLAO|nr:hypothetical protein [Allomuricauda maritima]RIV46475.1 hypothetical protein D2V05_03765 [Allomuricauda maritima]TXJ99136.1 hypothetical protein FQ017_03745 [Allomuricauda maritima]